MTLFFNFIFCLFSISTSAISFPKLISGIHSLTLILSALSHGIIMGKKGRIFYQLTFIAHIHIFLCEFSLCMINFLIFFLYFRNSSGMFVFVFVPQNLCWPAPPAHMNFCNLPKSWIASDYLFLFYLDR